MRLDDSGAQAMLPETMRGYVVRRDGERVASEVEMQPLSALPEADTLIRVAYSSVNYKDVMAATGHPGIVKSFPHVPGIDCAGTVVESAYPTLAAGDAVIATGHELGVERWGGWAEYVRVPGEWVVPLPAGLTPFDAMTLGTAGFTAVQGVLALEQHGITPDRGEIVVTGATGGVGSVALILLAKLGYRVAAVSGKRDRHAWLVELGAARVIDRGDLLDESDRPLLKARWAGGIDAVGGPLLASLIRGVQHRGCVATCGVVGGDGLPLTMYPFILRGVTLVGIDSAWCPRERRHEIWQRLAGAWRLEGLSRLARVVTLDDVSGVVSQMLAGESVGRPVVEVGGA